MSATHRTAFLGLLWLFGLCVSPSPVVPIANAQNGVQPLRVHPQNGRYFEYNGLPMVLFGHQGGLRRVPVPHEVEPEHMARVARFANHFYMAAHPTWVRASCEQLRKTLGSEGNWRRVRRIARSAHQHDVVVHLFFWSYKYNFEQQDWSGSDMVWPDPSRDGGDVLDGVSRRDIHELAIRKAAEHVGDMPNVVYNFMWEYNVRRGEQDPDGAFHRWWAGRLRQEIGKRRPDARPLVSIVWGRDRPAESGADFIVEEDGNGFFFGHPHTRPLSFGVPCVFISSDYVFADNSFSGWDEVPWDPRAWSNGQVGDYAIKTRDLGAMVTAGFHPAETWHSAREDTLDHYLQLRWYVENLPTWAQEPGKGIAREVLPDHVPSRRPTLANPEGYENGRVGARYGAVYAHPDGLPPAQAEVWVDVNGDGRFDPDPEAGERITMRSQGGGFEQGVLYTAEGPAGGRYVFRFADRNWNPPSTGGLVPGSAEGISYRTWE